MLPAKAISCACGELLNKRAAIDSGRHHRCFAATYEGVLAFLGGDMIDPNKVSAMTPNEETERPKFALIGREDAIDTTMKCFTQITTSASSDFPNTLIPVCYGMSGMGKTRMLEEGVNIMKRMELENVFGVIVPYDGNFEPQPVESSMSIATSFSWRLLFRFFLEGNCSKRG